MKHICVIIVTFNGERWIGGALDSLKNDRSGCCVTVVDNASTDSTAAIVRENYPEVRLICLSQNAGFGKGNNVGISDAIHSDAEYIFLLNQDAYVTETSIVQLIEFLDSHPEFDIATPLHCSPDLSTVDIKTQRNYLCQYAMEYISDACIGRVKDHYPIKGINAAAWMVRSSAFKKVGGFDPLFFMYGEDDDLIHRFNFHECRFALVPYARIVHLRQSPPSKSVSYWESILKMRDRVRASMLVDIKTPGTSVYLMISLILSQGFVRPIAVFIVDRDEKMLLAHLLAGIKLSAELPEIRRHNKQCESEGFHFLSKNE